MNVVIDTNCLIASIPQRNPEFWLYRAFRDGRFNWVISNEILTEYDEKISDFYSPKTANLVIGILLAAPNVILAEPFFHWNLIAQDPDDNKFSDLAISANVDWLVSNDHHFQILKLLKFPPVKVARLDEFKAILESIS